MHFNTIINGRTTIRGPAIIGDHCEIGPNSYIGPYTSIGNSVTILNSEIENSIIMEKTYIDCGKRITDSLIGRDVRILGYEQNIPRGYKLILGDKGYITIWFKVSEKKLEFEAVNKSEIESELNDHQS